jgi:hypothetical protein
MRRMLIFSVIFSVLSIAFSFLLSAHAAEEYSADIFIFPRGDEPIRGRIFVKGDKIRQETADNDRPQVMIIRNDKKLAWVIAPEERRYVETPYKSAENTFEQWTTKKLENAKFLSEETISGIPCKKYETMENGERTVFWISKQFPFPIKIEDAEMIMQYQNIEFSPIEDSLFELPAGYEKMTEPVVTRKEENK